MIGLDQRDPGAGGNVASDTNRVSNLWQRAASAAVLAPIAIACAYIGGWPFFVLCGLAAGAILWEWTALVVRNADVRTLAPGLAALLVAMILGGEGQAVTATAMIAIGSMIAAGIVAAWPRGYPTSNAALWAAGGVVYAGIALLSPILLRRDSELGLTAVLFLFATVWITDISAYLVGRTVGGWLLLPIVSPNKTWSGALGGLAGGVAAGTLVAYASGVTRPGVAGILALVLSIVAQCGDLFESAVKRRFGAKDAGGLIPGHGGVMDRLDGLLVAALAAVLIGIVHQGMAAPARGLLAW